MSDVPLDLIILARDQSKLVQEAWQEIQRFLNTRENTRLVAAAVTEDLVLDHHEADIIIVLGGDGAILRACRQLGSRQLPLLGVNLGRLGFLADLSAPELLKRYDEIEQRQYQVIDHLMYECELKHADGSSEKFLGLNEVVVSAAGSLGMLDINLRIDHEKVTTYSGDGLIISTPIGSTAHSLSAGGPILQQDLDVFVITPICPHTLTIRPVVDSAERCYTMKMDAVKEGVMLSIDGQIHRSIKAGDEVHVRKADVSCKLARLAGHHYYSILNRKLGWAGQPRYRKK
ncbi:MAG: NAD(+)/NADH kinase [Planctomycetaceae bacterium]|nr:NAD(+)/NADH kinase [Planctomycetaceae bacterium]